MSSNKKNRDNEFQNQITNFTAQLQEKVGFAKRGKPESKKKIRFGVCPKCDMKDIAQQYRAFSEEYLFPCICMNEDKLLRYNQTLLWSDENVMASVLNDLKSQCAVYFDMICVVEIAGYKHCCKISWKPLQENTWNRNNQPTCDNVRITAVSKAFVTIVSTCWGDIELHAYGPETINRKPYARLGVGVNMLSKHNWKPGFLFMTSSNSSLKEELRLVLKYPIQFEGKISVQWPRRGCETYFVSIFDINTNKNNNSICPQSQLNNSNINGNSSEDIQMHDKAVSKRITSDTDTFLRSLQEIDNDRNIEPSHSLTSFTDESPYRYSTTPETEHNFSDFHNSVLFNPVMDNDNSNNNDIENWNTIHHWPSYDKNDNINNSDNNTTVRLQPPHDPVDDNYSGSINSNNYNYHPNYNYNHDHTHSSSNMTWSDNTVNPDYTTNCMHSVETPLSSSHPLVQNDWPCHFNGNMDVSTQNDVINLACTCHCCGSVIHNISRSPQW